MSNSHARPVVGRRLQRLSFTTTALLLILCIISQTTNALSLPVRLPAELTKLVANDPTWKENSVTLQRRQNRAIKVMIVGDSITHGSEGDWTWRYRLWEWFRQEQVSVEFVGPFNGTNPAAKATPPRRPKLLEDEPTTLVPDSGQYARDVAPHFQRSHFSAWGRQAAQAKDLIREVVDRYQPDIILSVLGFNDMGWFVSDATGTLNSMREFVAEARKAKPDLAFALANVNHRSFLNGRNDLVTNTDDYNDRFPAAIESWQLPQSPIGLVMLRETYQCEPNRCIAAWDGLHPNALGEFQIAQAFSRTLITSFNVGAKQLEIPAVIPQRDTSIPKNVRATGSGVGVTVTWDTIFGARSFDVRHRRVGQNWEIASAPANRYDTSWTKIGEEFEYQIRTNNGNFDKSDWSDTVRAAAAPQLSGPPFNLQTFSTRTGFSLAWSKPTGLYSESVDAYELIWFDQDAPAGTFPGSKGVLGTFASIENLIPGHRYTVAITAWNKNGGGLPSVANSVTVNAGTPPPPTSLQIRAISSNSVELQWCGSREAAGYRLWQRNIGSAEPLKANPNLLPFATKHTVGFLPGSTERFEFCLSAINGSVESPRGDCIVAGRFGEGPTGALFAEADCYDGSIPGVVAGNPASQAPTGTTETKQGQSQGQSPY